MLEWHRCFPRVDLVLLWYQGQLHRQSRYMLPGWDRCCLLRLWLGHRTYGAHRLDLDSSCGVEQDEYPLKVKLAFECAWFCTGECECCKVTIAYCRWIAGYCGVRWLMHRLSRYMLPGWGWCCLLRLWRGHRKYGNHRLGLDSFLEWNRMNIREGQAGIRMCLVLNW